MKKWLWWIIGIGAPIVIGVLLWWLYQYRAEWAGFYTPHNSAYKDWKILWDWLELLIVPLILGAVLAIGGVLLNQAQRQSEQDIAKEREEERALQSYLDAMTALLLKESLRKSEANSEVRSVARARTLTVLRGLNEVRKASVLRFLYEAKLIGARDVKNVVVGLSEADLRGADLRRANLSGADLVKANLSGADLVKANLFYTSLIGARLEGTNLYEAYLCQAKLISGKLHKANLSRADLREALLYEADLRGADLEEATLFGAKLDKADLVGAEADLNEANLTNAKYNSETFEDASGIYQPTQWPADFDPVAAGAIDVSKEGE